MASTRYHFVVNPVAGRRPTRPMLEELYGLLTAAGDVVSEYVTTGPNDGARHVRSLEGDALDRLIVVGGDGTLKEVVNGRSPPFPWPVGVMPAGTANLVGRELGMPLAYDARGTAEALQAATPWTVNLLELERADGKRAIAVSNVGVGIDGEIVRAVTEHRATRAGAGGYLQWLQPIWRALRAYRFPLVRVTVDGVRTLAASSCIVQNANNYGGVFELAPEAALDSDALDVMLIRCRTNRDLFRILWGAWRGSLPRDKQVVFVRGTDVRLETDAPVAVQADGDAAGSTDVRVRLLPDALALLRVTKP